MTLPADEKLIDLICARRSIRKFLPDVPEPQVIDRLIEAAASAPNAHNAQPWRFYILENRGSVITLAQKMASRLSRDLERDDVNRQAADRKTAGSIETFSHAPVLILVCLDMTDMTAYRDASRAEAERTMGTQSVAAAVQNLLLAAWVLGLGGCWYCAPLFCPDLVRKELELPAAHQPQALITLGYPDKEKSKPSRKMIDEIRFRR